MCAVVTHCQSKSQNRMFARNAKIIAIVCVYRLTSYTLPTEMNQKGLILGTVDYI